MNKFESLNDKMFQKLEASEMSELKGGDRLWHTWLTGRTKYTVTSTNITYQDHIEYDEACDCKIEVIDWSSGS